jgi:hypothetical protein
MPDSQLLTPFCFAYPAKKRDNSRADLGTAFLLPPLTVKRLFAAKSQ